MHRPLHIWLTFLGCLLLIGGAMAWVTSHTLRLEGQREEAARSAETQERTRIALWRMDFSASALLIRENSRPLQDFTPFHSPTAFNPRDANAISTDSLLVPSPLLSGLPDNVLLHFQMGEQGDLVSPQAPQGNERSIALLQAVSEASLVTAEQRLSQLRALLARAPAGSSRQRQIATSRADDARRYGATRSQRYDEAASSSSWSSVFRKSASAPAAAPEQAPFTTNREQLIAACQAAPMLWGNEGREALASNSPVGFDQIISAAPMAERSEQAAPALIDESPPPAPAAPAAMPVGSPRTANWAATDKAAAQQQSVTESDNYQRSKIVRLNTNNTFTGNMTINGGTLGMEDKDELKPSSPSPGKAKPLLSKEGTGSLIAKADEPMAKKMPDEKVAPAARATPAINLKDTSKLAEGKNNAAAPGKLLGNSAYLNFPTDNNRTVSGPLGSSVILPAAAAEMATGGKDSQQASVTSGGAFLEPSLRSASELFTLGGLSLSGGSISYAEPDSENYSELEQTLAFGRYPEWDDWSAMRPSEAYPKSYPTSSFNNGVTSPGPLGLAPIRWATMFGTSDRAALASGLNADITTTRGYDSFSLPPFAPEPLSMLSHADVEPLNLSGISLVPADSSRGFTAPQPSAGFAPSAIAVVPAQPAASAKPLPPQSAAPTDASPLPLQGYWLDDALILSRQATVQGQRVIQGVWLDWPKLRESLLADIRDLFPQAQLTAVPQLPGARASDDPLRLAALPLRFEPGVLALPPLPFWSPLRTSLAVALACMGLAALAVALVLHGAVSLSERRAAFVSAVTHELRTPLTTFRLYSEMLADDMVQDPEQRRSYLDTLTGEATRLSHLVENVLAYAQLERGSARARVEKVSLGQVLDRIAPRLRQRTDQANSELRVSATEAERAAALHVDVAALEQILFNLVDNACKYAAPRASEPIIHLEAGTSGKLALLRVRDHGTGIAPHEQRRIFRPFHKSADEAAHTAPGVGLGLALCRRLVAALGGSIALDPSVRPGACFVVSLPMA